MSIDVLTGDPFMWEVQGVRSAVAIGVFDGVHLGHQQVLETLVKRAAEIDGIAVALTFDPHPLEFVDPARAPKLLTSIDERAEVMEACGVGIMGVLPFVQIRDLEPGLFAAEILSYRLNAAWVAVGGNFRFGHNRSGDPELLARVGSELGFDVDVVSMFGDDEHDVFSSTRIRAELGHGRVAEAARLLGRRFSLAGPVVHGDARGRSIGFPTANLHIPERMAVPADGVYAVFAEVTGRRLPAVVNIGVRPTFGVNARAVEVHLLDFSADVYGEEVEVEFVERIRGEQRFESLDALTAQIARDVATARSLLSERNGKDA
ncbi:MAG TPA: bifunctional riboflavin kinase/FAD synthetase [Acidimicrobiia bacterium]